jgi:hypothetical protein
MTKKMQMLDSLDARGSEINTGAERLTLISPPVVLGSIKDLQPGSVLIKANVRLPESMQFESRQYGAWKLLIGANGFSVERELSKAGWHFFFMVPEIRVGALSFNRAAALRKAFKKLRMAADTQNVNGLEIAEITTKRFLGLDSITIVAHPRHIEDSTFLRGLDPHYVARNVWNFKGILRRRARIGRTFKGI